METVLETARLRLVPVSEAHVDDIFRYFDEKVTAYMVPGPAADKEETRAVVRRFIRQRENGTDFVFAITRRTDGEFLGLAGLHDLESGVPELGIWTKTQTHGHRFGREAVGGLIEEARRRGFHEAVYPVDKRNVPSRKIPLFYGGRLIEEAREFRTQDGRLLEIEQYAIPL